MIFRTSLIQFNYIPLIQSPRISFSHDGFLVHIRFTLFQFLFQPVQREVKVVVAVEVEVIAHTAAIGRDGLVVGDAVEAEELLLRRQAIPLHSYDRPRYPRQFVRRR